MIRKVAWFLFFAVLAVSCLDEPDCYNLNNNIVGISFRKLADNKADTLAIVGVTIEGTDSIFHSFRLVTGLELPLNFYTSESDIVIEMLDRETTVAKTLSLGYNSRIQFVSEDCGEKFVISDLDVIASDFDSVRVVNSSPGNTPTTNVIVYRCPVTDLMRIGFRQLFMDEDSLGDPLDVFVNGIAADFLTNPLYSQDTASSFLLPLNPESAGAQYEFDFTSGSGTLEVGYRAVDSTRYALCGPQTFFADLAIVASDFDITTVVKDSIQDPPVTNIMLQRCPDTNLVRIAFKESAEEGAPDVPVTITGITAEHTPEVFYSDSTVSSVTLPLNEQADITRYSIGFEDSTVDIELGYDRTPVVYHEVCNRMTFTSLHINSSGFESDPQVPDDEINFPANTTNVAIILD